MIERCVSFLIGAMPALIIGAAVLSGPIPGQVQDTDKSVVCHHGYAHERRASATYGGLVPAHGYQRDHNVPICLGGADTVENVYYQPLDEAHKKDELERLACRAVCHGEMSLGHAQSMFLGGDWKDSYREVFGAEP